MSEECLKCSGKVETRHQRLCYQCQDYYRKYYCNKIEKMEVNSRTVDRISTFQGLTLTENSKILNFLFYGKARCKGFTYGIPLILGVFVILYTMVSLIEGTFSSTHAFVGWSTDYIWWSTLLAIGLLLFGVRSLCEKFLDAFTNKSKLKSIIDNRIISDKEYQEMISYNIDFIEGRTITSRNGMRLTYLIGVLVTIIYGVLFQFALPRGLKCWHLGQYPFGWGIFFVSLVVIIVFIGPPLVWRIYSIITSTRDLTYVFNERDAFIISPYNPDGNSGFEPIGEIALSMNYIGLVPLISTTVYFLREINLLIISVFPILVGVLVFSFAFPLMPSHRILVNAKRKHLKSLYERNKRINSELASRRSEAAQSALRNNLTEIRLFKEMYEWPFNMSILGQFLAAVIIPILLFSIQMLLT